MGHTIHQYNELICNAKEQRERMLYSIELMNKQINNLNEEISMYGDAIKLITTCGSEIKTSQDLVLLMCDTWNVTTERLFKQNRKRELVEMRLILVAIVERRFKLKEATLARIIKRDRTTVLHCLNCFNDRMKTQDSFFMKYFEPVKHLYNGNE